MAAAALGVALAFAPNRARPRLLAQVGGFDEGDVPALREGEWEDSAQAAQLEDNYGDMPGAQLVAPPTSTIPAGIARECIAHDWGAPHLCTDVHPSERSDVPVYSIWPPV